ILLLDEPLSALDRGTAHRLREELRSLHSSRNLTILHVTHDLNEARRMGRRIAMIHEGRLHAIGTAESLLRRPPTLFAATFFGALNVCGGRAKKGDVTAGPIRAKGQKPIGNRLHLMVYPGEAILLPGDAQVGGNLLPGEIHGFVDEGDYMAIQIQIAGLPA